MFPRMRKRILSTRRYTPAWKGFIEGFVVNFLKKNFWRVQAHMEYEDCLQEAQYTFLRLKQKYGNMDKPQHFMALFKTTWVNEFHDLAIRDQKLSKEVACEKALPDAQLFDPENDESNYFDLLIGDFDNNGMFAIMLEQAPSEVKLVLQLFLTAPVEVLDMFSSKWKERNKRKEFGNAHLCEILGIEPAIDIIGKVTDYFSNN